VAPTLHQSRVIHKTRGEDCHLSLPACLPCVAPDQLRLDGFEERLNSSVIVTIPRTAHGDLKVVLAQDFLIVV
jgi:hypothetical protein